MARYDHDPYDYYVPIQQAPWKRKLEYDGHVFMENLSFSVEVARWLGGGFLRLAGVSLAIVLVPVWLPFVIIDRLLN